MSSTAPADLAANLAVFAGVLRSSGVAVGPGESIDALRALCHLDVRQRSQVYLGLRSALVKRPEHYPVYDGAFRTFFDGEVPGRSQTERTGPDGDATGDGARAGFSAEERLLTADLGALSATAYAEVAAVALRLARRLAARLSRRRRRARRGGRISMRATVREASRRAGHMVRLRVVQRRVKRGNLVLLLDVSGSMERYSRVLLQFVHALQAGLPRTQSFCFATRLCRVSGELSGPAFEEAARQAQAKLSGWGGGTRIGPCLQDYLDRYPPAPRTSVIILSDGLDTGDPDLVRRAMAALRRRTRRLVWLNPLAGDSRYQPLARAMAAALPYLDTLAPGHSLGSLLSLESHLKGEWRRSTS